MDWQGGLGGELILGGMSEVVDGQSVKWVPVSNKTFIHIDRTVHSNSQVSASAATVGDGTLINSTTSANTTSWIEMEFPLLGLPHEMADDIHTLVGARQIGWSPFYSVPMGKQHTFSAGVFMLGEEEVTITGLNKKKLYEPAYTDAWR